MFKHFFTLIIVGKEIELTTMTYKGSSMARSGIYQLVWVAFFGKLLHLLNAFFCVCAFCVLFKLPYNSIYYSTS